MQGGETYLSAFALLLHAGPLQIGLLSALPPIIGAWSQLISVKLLNRIKGRNSLILCGAMGQALTWLTLAMLPMLAPSHATWLLLASATMYFVMGNLIVPAWNGVITGALHPDERGAYFARRGKIVAVVSFAALVVAGLVLHASSRWETPWLGFATIFLLASAARMISIRYLRRLPESTPSEATRDRSGFGRFMRDHRNAMFRRFLLFSGSFYAAAMIAGPFFVVYLLRDLHLTYVQYGLWLAAPILAQLVSLKEWGHIADTFGNKNVLVVTGLAIPILPMLYLCSTNWMFLVAINFLSGTLWPGFSLSLQNYVFDIVRPEDRPKGVAVYHTVNAVGAGMGALLGGWLASVAPSPLLFFGITLPLV